MMRHILKPTLLVLGLAAASVAGAEDAQPPTPREIVDAAPASDWRVIPAEEMVVMTLADGHKVVWQLAPFSPVHTGNIRALIGKGWFDGSSIIRVQDGYVVQWGFPDEPEPALPEGVLAEGLPAEYDFPLAGQPFWYLPVRDAYAKWVGHTSTWPAATDGKDAWLLHCYGMIGVARGMAPDTGSGTQLYTTIGHAPRGLDRNLTVVGRVIGGMEWLTSRPRGTSPLGFYETGPERLVITSVKLASDLPEGERPAYKVLNPGSRSFKAWFEARSNGTNGGFLVTPPGAQDICNTQAPIREIVPNP